MSSVTYLEIWRCHHISRWRCGVSYERCGCECGGCASLKEMIHLQWETTASPAGDAVSPEGDLLASPNFEICNTTHLLVKHSMEIVDIHIFLAAFIVSSGRSIELYQTKTI
jgi:hypothetical protein